MTVTKLRVYWAALAAIKDELTEEELNKVEEKVDNLNSSIRYAPNEDADYWKTLPEAAGSDWARFRQAIIDAYPGAETNGTFTRSNLEKLVNERSAAPITTRDELGKYFRAFVPITAHLITTKKISDLDRDRYFMQGLDAAFSQRVRARLAIKSPDHPYDDPYPYADVNKAAAFLLTEVSSEPAARLTHAVKAEPADDMTTMMKTFFTQFGTAYAQMATNARPAPVYPPRQPWGGAAASGANATPMGDRGNNCMFCGKEGEYMRDCPTLNEYLTAGKVIRGPDRRLVLPNGRELPFVPGGTLKARTDRHYESAPAPALPNNFREDPPHMTNLISVATTAPQTATIRDEELLDILKSLNVSVEEGEDPIAAVFEAAAAKTKKAKEVRVDDPPAHPKQTTFRPANLPPKTPRAAPVAPAPPPPDPALSHQPQFHYRAPIEEGKTVQAVIDRALDSTVTITNRELLAISPEVRKSFKDATTTRKVPTGSHATSARIVEIDDDGEPNPLPPHNATCKHAFAVHTGQAPTFLCDMEGCGQRHPYPTAARASELRAIYPVFNGTHEIESLLDSGSEVTCMRRAVWEKLGVPLSEDGRMRLETADTHSSVSTGTIEHLKLTIGGVDSYHTIIVMENAGYDVLLGQPFYQLLKVGTTVTDNNEQHISIADPVNGRRITVPTSRRKRKQPTEVDF